MKNRMKKKILGNDIFKGELLSLIAKHPKTVSTCKIRKSTPHTLATKCSLLFKLNHKETETALILHAILAYKDVVVVSNDTDVLIILIWAYQKFNINNKYNSTMMLIDMPNFALLTTL